VKSSPFYLHTSPAELPQGHLTAQGDLLNQTGLMPDYNKLCKGKMKENLSDFLTSVEGKIDVKTISDAEGLTGLLRKPPSMQRDLNPLSYEQISAFKLQPGRLGDVKNSLSSSHRKKKKRRDHEDGEGKKHRRKKKKRENNDVT